jgi:hypothetical protein
MMSVIRELFIFRCLPCVMYSRFTGLQKPHVSDSYGQPHPGEKHMRRYRENPFMCNSQCLVETAMHRKIHPRADSALNRNRQGQIAIILLLWFDLKCGTTMWYRNIASEYATLEQLLSRPTVSQGCCYRYIGRRRMYQYLAAPCLRLVYD